MQNQINLEVIDQFFAAQLRANESEATLKALRPQVEEAVAELLRQRGLPRNYTGTVVYNGIRILIRRPKSYTWEQNNSLRDANLDYYKQQHNLYVQLNEDLKELRADMKRTAEKLEKAHPDSESIKYGLNFVISK